MIVVSDTSPITNLAAIGQLDLLRQLYQRVVIPEAVYDELIVETGRHPGAVVQYLDWIELGSASDLNRVDALLLALDRGEAEAIVLAQEMNAAVLLMDEFLGRATATQLGLRVVGLLGVLIEAKQQGLIDEIKPLIDMLLTLGFRVHKDLYAQVLSVAGE